MAQNSQIIGVDDKISAPKQAVFGIQHFAALISGGAIVPALLMGLDPAIALMASGIGTLLFLLVTKGRIPAYMGVSFALISPVILVSTSLGVDAALGGIVVAGLIFIAMGVIIKLTGTGWLDKVFPPVLVGSIIIVIGVGLAPDAISMVFFNNNADAGFNGASFLVGMVTLFACVILSCCFEGFIGTLSVLAAIVIGYVVSIPLGFVDFSGVAEAAWIGLPSITTPRFDLSAILTIAPIAFVVIVDHLGKMMVIGDMIDRDCMSTLPKSLIGNGLATTFSGCVGGPVLTPIAENVGVMGVTRVYSARPFWWAAAFAVIVGGFCPKLSAVILSIPAPVLGGVSLLLFGTIAISGARLFVENKVNFNDNRNAMIAAVVLIVGIGMTTAFITVPVGDLFSIPGLFMATLIGVIMNLVLPRAKDASASTAPADEPVLDQAQA